MYRKFYSYNDMPVVKQPAPSPVKEEKNKVKPVQNSGTRGVLSGMENDDIILLIVLLVLIMDNCEDRLLLLALGFVFFSDYFS